MLSAAKQFLRQGDVRGLFGAVAERRPQWVFRRTLFYLFQLRLGNVGNAHNGEARLPEGYEFSRATLEEVLRDSELAAHEREEYTRRFTAGDHCYAVFDGLRCVNLTWLHFGACYVRGPGLLLELNKDEGYVYGVVTRPSHRGLGLYTAAQSRLIELLSRERVHRLLQLVEANNTIPLKVLAQLGYERMQNVRSLTALGGKLTLIQQLATMTNFQQVHLRSPPKIFRI